MKWNLNQNPRTKLLGSLALDLNIVDLVAKDEDMERSTYNGSGPFKSGMRYVSEDVVGACTHGACALSAL